MWPTTYWPRSYWPPSYWPKGPLVRGGAVQVGLDKRRVRALLLRAMEDAEHEQRIVEGRARLAEEMRREAVRNMDRDFKLATARTAMSVLISEL